MGDYLETLSLLYGSDRHWKDPESQIYFIPHHRQKIFEKHSCDNFSFDKLHSVN